MHRKTDRLPLVLMAWLGLITASPVGAQPARQSMEDCLAYAADNPDAAGTWAKGWARRGGGHRAWFCVAMADYHAGRFQSAAEAMESLADRLGERDERLGANVYMRAAWAWLRAGDAKKAEGLYTRALELRPDDVDLLIDRSYARAEAGRFEDALVDLTRAVTISPERPDALLLRAGAHQSLGDLDSAEADIAAALALRPDDPDALLARGNLAAAKRDPASALADWSRVQRLAPRTAAGRAAAANLERLQGRR